MSFTKETATPEQWAEFLAQRRARYAARKVDDPEWYARQSAYLKRYQSSPKGRAKEKQRYQKQERKDYVRVLARFHRYGITAKQQRDLWLTQGGKCGVCRAHLAEVGPGTKHVHVDHNHETGVVRGLLCSSCNQIDGHLNKIGVTPAAFAARLQAYLDSPPAQEEVLW